MLHEPALPEDFTDDDRADYNLARKEMRRGAAAQKPAEYLSVRNILAAAVRSGAVRERLHCCEWNIAGDCKSPRRLQRYARPPAPFMRVAKRRWKFAASNEPGSLPLQTKSVTITGVASGLTPRRQAPVGEGSAAGGMWTQQGLTPIWITQIVRCGKCAACLRVRARKWQVRALSEISRATRTWFVTLTIRPDIHHWIRAQAAALFEKAYDERKPGDFDALPSDVQFAKCVAVGFEEVTRYFKRIRHTTTAGVRYLLVAEPHTGGGKNHGLPHFHLLIHETGEATLRKRVLDNRWRWGHTKAKLVREFSDSGKPVGYLCKYLSKCKTSRLRASLHYGNVVLRHSVLKEHVKTNDPTPFHCVKESDSERQEKKDETVRIAADAAIGTGAAGQEDPNVIGREVAHEAHRQGGLQSRPQGLSVSMTRTFKRLAAKGTVRSDPAVESASKVTHALLGHKRQPTGPFSVVDGSERNTVDDEEPLPVLELEDRSEFAKDAKSEREELLLRNAAAAVARNAPAARRARVRRDNARIARKYGTRRKFLARRQKFRARKVGRYRVHTASLHWKSSARKPRG